MSNPKKDQIGLAWYTAEEWQALRRVSADRGDMDASHAEWLAGAEEYLRALRKNGLNVVPVPVQVSELVAWCKKNKRRIDSKARSEFVSFKLQSGEMDTADEALDMRITRVPRRRHPLPLLNTLEKMYEQSQDRATPPPYPYDEEHSLIRLPAKVVQEVQQLVRSGDVPAAVQRVEKLTGCGLGVAKAYVDGFRDDL
ncbi:MAG: hypothetical protein DWI57_14260 [Chloroflexi bacterium]|nr:MAG: hypothetical protein DWI57_14260 [Chloroflexota bacterium]